MSVFLPEGSNTPSLQSPGVAEPTNPEVTDADLKLMQRIFSAASQYPNMIPDQFMGYLLDFVQTSGLIVPIGQVFGYQKIAPQVVTDLATVPAPVDGQIVLLKVGSGAPYTYVQMMYDQNLAQWVSEEFPAGGAAASSAVNGFANVGGMTGLSWKPVTQFGLTFQLKWAGTLENEGGGTGDARILLTWATIGGGSSGYSSTTTMAQSVVGDAVTRAVGVDWTTVASPGSYDMVAIGFQAGRNAGSGGTTVVQAGAVGRFIK